MEARNGFSTETRSLNGNGRRALCFGFTVNVRVPPFFIFTFLMGTRFYSGVRKDSSIVCTIPFLPFQMTD
jgi:hypothetical protein